MWPATTYLLHTIMLCINTLTLVPLPQCLGKNKMSGVPACQAESGQTFHQ